jgi:hypothetical protein
MIFRTKQSNIYILTRLISTPPLHSHSRELLFPTLSPTHPWQKGHVAVAYLYLYTTCPWPNQFEFKIHPSPILSRSVYCDSDCWSASYDINRLWRGPPCCSSNSFLTQNISSLQALLPIPGCACLLDRALLGGSLGFFHPDYLKSQLSSKHSAFHHHPCFSTLCCSLFCWSIYRLLLSWQTTVGHPYHRHRIPHACKILTP